MLALRRVPTRCLGRAPTLGRSSGDNHGKEAQDISDVAGLLRSCDRGAVDEGGARGLGRRQQSLPSGYRQRDGRPDVVAATMSKPGVVLKRPAGSNGRFAEHSDLPSNLESGENRTSRGRHRQKPAKRAAPKISEGEAREAAADFEKERKRREAERQREEAGPRKRSRAAGEGDGQNASGTGPG